MNVIDFNTDKLNRKLACPEFHIILQVPVLEVRQTPTVLNAHAGHAALHEGLGKESGTREFQTAALPDTRTAACHN